MDASRIRINDILSSKYPDFCAYCEVSGKVFVSELSTVDFVAFRTRMNVSREYVSNLKAFIEKAVSTSKSENQNSIPEKSYPSSRINIEHQISSENVLHSNANNEDINIDSIVASGMREEENKNEQKPSEVVNEAIIEINNSESDELIPFYAIFKVDSNNYSIPVSELQLSSRALNCLSIAKCTTVKELLTKSISDLRSMRNMGEKSINEIVAKIKDFLSDASHRLEKNKSTQRVTKIDNNFCSQKLLRMHPLKTPMTIGEYKKPHNQAHLHLIMGSLKSGAL